MKATFEFKDGPWAVTITAEKKEDTEWLMEHLGHWTRLLAGGPVKAQRPKSPADEALNKIIENVEGEKRG